MIGRDVATGVLFALIVGYIEGRFWETVAHVCGWARGDWLPLDLDEDQAADE